METTALPESLDLSRFEHFEGNGAWDTYNWGLELVESYVDPEHEVAIGRYPDSQGGGWCIEQGLAREVHTLEGPYESPEGAYRALLAAEDLSGHALTLPAPEDASQTFVEAVLRFGGELVDDSGAFAYGGYVYAPGEHAVGWWLDGNPLNLVPVRKER